MRLSIIRKFKTIIGSLGFCLFTPVFPISLAWSDTVNGDLAITGDLIAEGDIRVEGQTANRKSFFIGGDPDTYYPVFFRDLSWHFGAMDLQVYRPNVHTDSSWQGSLMARFRSHSSHWGHGSDFIEAAIRHNKTPHIANYKLTYHLSGVVIWLKGQSTYYYHAAGKNPAIDFNDSGDGYIVVREHNGQIKESYVSRSEVNSDLLLSGRTFSDSASFKGNVGIGVGSPSHKLDVNGTIRAKEVIVESGWADYVFEDDYALPSLGYVKSHIQEHRHLPGVPSAEVIAESGVSLGDSQRILMEKIEELTLYAIRQEDELSLLRQSKDDQIENLASRNAVLEERLHRIEEFLAELVADKAKGIAQ